MFKIKISLADRLFSLYIRTRDNWTCQRCFCDFSQRRWALDNSHFWGRGNKSVRFDPENVIAACKKCHQILTANPGEHIALFWNRLGPVKYDALGVRARTPTKVDEKLIAMGLKIELKAMGVSWTRRRGPALSGPGIQPA